jgi:hypothetical protein
LSQGRSYSEQTAYMVDEEVRNIIDDVYERTVTLLRGNQDKLELLAQALLENEVVDQEMIRNLIGVEFGGANADAILNPGGLPDVIEPELDAPHTDPVD